MHFSSAVTASGLAWQPRAEDSRLALAMAQQHGISELLAGILVGREVTLDTVADFLNPTLREYLPDPFHLRDMDKAVSRILLALERGERIAVFGDYDVDGATSTALLVQYFRALGVEVTPYIPDRMKEGYGPTVGAFAALMGEPLENNAADSGLRSASEPRAAGGSEAWGARPPSAKLILTVDCGTLAHAPIAYAQERGVDVIVIDHHLSDGALPNAHAIVNPNRVDETSPHTNLAAVGVTFLLLVALNSRIRDSGFRIQGSLPNLLHLLDLVALGTVCDVMTLTGLNRAYVSQGLKVMSARRNTGLATLADIARMEEAPNVYALGFQLGPRINAGGRVGESGLGVALLTSDDRFAAEGMAAQLDQYNAERQAIEASVLDAARIVAATQANLPVMVVAGEGWHQGVIGIVAGRLKEEYQRPVAVIALDGGKGKASARSVPGADFGAAVHAALAMGLLTAGGGHAMASGFSLEADRLEALHAFLITRMEGAVAAYTEGRVRKYDGLISVAGANLVTLDDISRAGPFGLGNPAPRFVIRDAQIVHRQLMKEKHVRLTLADGSGSARLTAVAFHVMESQLGAWLMTERNLHLLGELKRNSWQGNESAQFVVEDAAKG